MGAGPEGTVFKVTNAEYPWLGSSIKKFDQSDNTFKDVDDAPNNILRVDVDMLGQAWAVDLYGIIHSYIGNDWIV